MSLWFGHRLGVTASVNLVGLFTRIFGSCLSGSCVFETLEPGCLLRGENPARLMEATVTTPCQ